MNYLQTLSLGSVVKVPFTGFFFYRAMILSLTLLKRLTGCEQKILGELVHLN